MNIISEHKKVRAFMQQTKVPNGMKRVMAIVNGKTRHLDVPK